MGNVSEKEMSLKIKAELDLDKYSELFQKLAGLFNKVIKFRDSLKNVKAVNECRGGLLIRLSHISRCISQIVRIAPPGRRNRFSIDEYYDLNIYSHEFYLHLSGIFDNLAWIWFYEKNDGEFLKKNEKNDKKDNKNVIGFFKKDFIKYFKSNQGLYNLHSQHKDWYQYLSEYRDPLAHSIPIVVGFYTMQEDTEYVLIENFDIYKSEKFDHLVFINPYAIEKTWDFYHDKNLSVIERFINVAESFLDRF